MARMKREEWYNIARDVDWTRSYVDEEAVFPEWLSGSGKVPREAWKSWDEPYKCAYPDYVATQREKKARSTRSRPPYSAPISSSPWTRAGSRPPKRTSASFR